MELSGLKALLEMGFIEAVCRQINPRIAVFPFPNGVCFGYQVAPAAVCLNEGGYRKFITTRSAAAGGGG
jgi:hypothetical protein